ncbi:MAG: hypothetical protein JWR21_2385 [Herminiimonas sp.]|nr:hypothetical protein [Herminiimonas sp.]
MNEELQELVRTPREDLDIELKQWMDPADKVVQAKFAKELLALRNHGGGYLVVGFKDEHPVIPDPNRPIDLAGFSTDVFNNTIKKYAEPSFHCMSHVIAHPVTGETYPVIVVPGGAKVPVRCKADSPDGGKSAKVDAYYIRRPGPESSPPQSGAEWDALLQRCLLGRKDELLSSFAAMLGAGSIGVLGGLQLQPPMHPFADLHAFRDDAVAKLEALQNRNLPAGDEAKFEHGRYILSARVLGDLKQVSAVEMRELLQGLRKYTGWPPMNVFTRRELEPYVVGDNIIECWLAKDDTRDVAHADFWRVSTNAEVTLIRGHQEDGFEFTQNGGPVAGSALEVTLPAWRIAEFLLRVKELGEKLTTGPFRLQLMVEWEGLSGRKLISYGGRRRILNDFIAHDSSYRAEIEVSPEEVEAALPAVISKLVTPLMHKFSFFQPPKGFYEEEVEKFLRREFV